MSVSCVVLARLLVLLVSLVLWVLLVCLVSLVCLVCLLVLVARFVWDLLGPVVVRRKKGLSQPSPIGRRGPHVRAMLFTASLPRHTFDTQ